MAKREIPLFIVDTSRNHKRGECDFLVCTDKDNGFLAKVDYVDGEKEEVGDDYLNTMVRMNRQYLDDAGSDYQARKTVQQTIIMLQASAKFLREE